MGMDISDEEFAEDFGAPVPEGEELDRMLAEARRTNNVQLRRLIKHHQALKYLAEKLLQRVEDHEHPGPEDQVFKLASCVIRGK